MGIDAMQVAEPCTLPRFLDPPAACLPATDYKMRPSLIYPPLPADASVRSAVANKRLPLDIVPRATNLTLHANPLEAKFCDHISTLCAYRKRSTKLNDDELQGFSTIDCEKAHTGGMFGCCTAYRTTKLTNADPVGGIAIALAGWIAGIRMEKCLHPYLSVA